MQLQLSAPCVFALDEPISWRRSFVELRCNECVMIKRFHGRMRYDCTCFWVGWLSGREAEYMEKLDVEEVGRKCVEVLKKFLKNSMPKLPTLKKVSRFVDFSLNG